MTTSEADQTTPPLHEDGKVAVGPKVEGVQWKYYSGYYDGPLSGMVILPGGREVWAYCVDQCDCPRWSDVDLENLTDEELDALDDPPPVHGFYRRFQLTELAPEHAATEAERHAAFRALVGTHMDIGENGRRSVGAVHPLAWHSQFYDKWLSRTGDITIGSTPLGWFER